MPIGRPELMAKARAITISIQKMTKDERRGSPAGNYGEDYNRLRTAALKAYPDLEPLMPPAVVIESSASYGHPFTRQSFAEIDTFCEQIYQLLNEQPGA